MTRGRPQLESPGLLRAAALIGICSALTLSGGRASAEAPDAELKDAFSLGAGDDGAPRLDIEKHGRTTVLFGSASTEGGPRELSLVCALCSRSELLAESRALGALLAAAGTRGRAATVELTGLPKGVAVSIDGVPIRAGGRAQPLEAGRHEVRAEGPTGPRFASLRLAPGESRRLAWDELENGRPSPRAIRVSLAAGGSGIAVVAAGTALLLLDGDCATPRRNTDGDCAKLHDVAPLGWALVGAGAAVLVFAAVYGIAAERTERARRARAGGAR